MKNRKLKLMANVAGFDTVIAEVKIQNFADEVDVKEWTELVCPICGEPTQWHGGYVCQKDNATYNHWSKLMRVIRGTKTALKIPRLLDEKEEAVAHLFYLPVDEFAKGYVDATRQENGEKGLVIAEKKEDKARAMAINLFKCIVAVEKDGKVIIAKWNDTNEEVIALLERSRSGRIVFREIIPSNLVSVRETLFLDENAITPADVKEAGDFIKHFIPKATPETFEVKDYRAQWKEGRAAEAPAEPVGEKVADIKAIMAAMKQVVEVPASKPKKKAK